MTAIHETAYPRLKPHPTLVELEKNFMPTDDERILMEVSTRSPSITNKLGFMVMLKCYQCLGYAVNLKDVPEAVICYISQAIGGMDMPDISGYASSSRKRHRKIILQHLNISDDDHKQRDIMKQSALKSAVYKEGLADIINDMIETLVKERFELPGFSTLERMARAARVITSTKLYEKITAELNDETKVFLDSLFDTAVAPNTATSCWAFLKQEIKAPTTQNVKQYSDCLSKLKEWRSKIPATIDVIPAHRLEQFIAEATALDSSDMKNLKQDKRYALAVTMLHFKLANGFDDIANVMIRWMRKMRHEARQALDAYTLTKKGETERLIEVLHCVLLASNKLGTPVERLDAIEKSFPPNKEETILQCEQYLAHAGDNYLPFMLKLYQNKRYVLFQLLEQIQLRSASQDKSLEKAAAFIIKHRQNKQKIINIVASDFEQLSWLSDKWFNLVTDNKRQDEIIHSMIKFLNLTRQIFSVTRSYARFARYFAVENMDVAQRTAGFCPALYQIS